MDEPKDDKLEKKKGAKSSKDAKSSKAQGGDAGFDGKEEKGGKSKSRDSKTSDFASKGDPVEDFKSAAKELEDLFGGVKDAFSGIFKESEREARKRDRWSVLVDKVEDVIDRLDSILPPKKDEPDWNSAIAFRWQKVGNTGILQALPHPHTFSLKRLRSVNKQMDKLVRNTEQFLASKPANNALLTGARGTGKSSLIKALLHEYHGKGLRLVEVDKSDLATLPSLLVLLEKRPEKFIVFCDDLSFETGDDAYKALKTALDGGLSVRCDNVLVYATSNRRHLMPEYMDDNIANHVGEEVHPQEAVEEKVSLSDRFGLWLSFYPFSQDEYLSVVRSWIEEFGFEYGEDVEKAALDWSLTRSARSGRVAYQFVSDWVGSHS